MERNKGLVGFLMHLSAITYLLGAVISLYLLNVFSRPGVFDKGAFDWIELIIVGGIAFGHLVVGTLCMGVSHILYEVSRSPGQDLAEEDLDSELRAICPGCSRDIRGLTPGQVCEDCRAEHL